MAKSFGLPPISERKSNKKIIEFIMKNVQPGKINEYVGSTPLNLNITPNKPEITNEPDISLDEMKNKELLLLAEQYGLTKFSKQNKEVLRESQKTADKLESMPDELMPDEFVIEMAINFIGIGRTKNRTKGQLIRAILAEEKYFVLNKYIINNSSNATVNTETSEEDILNYLINLN